MGKTFVNTFQHYLKYLQNLIPNPYYFFNYATIKIEMHFCDVDPKLVCIFFFRLCTLTFQDF